jgi:glc operon protein GlcG
LLVTTKGRKQDEQNFAFCMGGPATATLAGVFASPGGLPVMVDGKVTGGVGVSGVTGDQDAQCSSAGLK